MNQPLPPPNPPRDDDAAPQEVSTGRASYNTVTDLVGGLNVRRSDNRLQAKAALIGLLIGGLPGLIFGSEGRWVVAGLGGLFGTTVAVFGTGIYLMIYRAIRHVKGKHD